MENYEQEKMLKDAKIFKIVVDVSLILAMYVHS
jgi:hypothetical protein